MDTTALLAKHLKEVYFGGNWTWSNLNDQLQDLSWEQAVAEVYGLNSIATLVYHIDYYVGGVSQYFRGEPLGIKDKFSFDRPAIRCQEDWESLLQQARSRAAELAFQIESLPDEKLWETFSEEKYGNYYRNVLGIIEHTHYHLGQISLLKKILAQKGHRRII